MFVNSTEPDAWCCRGCSLVVLIQQDERYEFPDISICLEANEIIGYGCDDPNQDCAHTTSIFSIGGTGFVNLSTTDIATANQVGVD